MAELHYFPMYAGDWLAGEATTLMSCEQEGAFIRLLCISWLTTHEVPCSIPSDPTALASLSKLRRRWGSAGAFVIAQFEPVEGHADRLRNPRLWAVFQEQTAKHEKRVSSGSKGGKARAKRKQSSSNATAMLKRSSSNALAKGKQSESESELEPETTNNNSIPAARGWPSELAEFWGRAVAPIPPGRVGSALKSAIGVHGAEKVRVGMEAYVFATPSGRHNLQQFANAANHWIDKGKDAPRLPSGDFSMTTDTGDDSELAKIVYSNNRRSA